MVPEAQASETTSRKARAAFYVDGFNFYHALDDLDKPHLKWLNWFRLAQLIANNRQEKLVKVVLCTAPPRHKPDALPRHQAYFEALHAASQLCGIELDVRSGWFIGEERTCRSCKINWTQHTEKEGDVSLALSMLEDAYEDVYDTGYLVTSDSDQAPTLKTISRRFGEGSANRKQTVVAFPIWRYSRRSSHILTSLAGNDVRINEKMVEQSLLPSRLPFRRENGQMVFVNRPERYKPPVEPTPIRQNDR